MTYKPAGEGRVVTIEGTVGNRGRDENVCAKRRRRHGRGGGQWEDACAALADTGGSIRCERSTMGAGEREEERCGLSVRTEDRGDVTHARGTVNASAIRQTH